MIMRVTKMGEMTSKKRKFKEENLDRINRRNHSKIPCSCVERKNNRHNSTT